MGPLPGRRGCLGAKMSVCRMALALALMPQASYAYPGGAASCTVPSNHGSGLGSATTSFDAPSEASSGASVTVTLSGSSFKGFIVKSTQGTFIGHSASTQTKAKTCSGFSSAATHTSGAAKTSVSFTLIMPASGSVTIQGQVVSSSRVSHTVTSTTINVVSSSPPPPVVDCVGGWGSWGTCSASCGGGMQSRSYTVSTTASGGGASCAESNGARQTRTCNPRACPVAELSEDCSGSWGSWGACSVTCGVGTQTRRYEIVTPASGGGASCNSADGDTQSQECNAVACASTNSDSSEVAAAREIAQEAETEPLPRSGPGNRVPIRRGDGVEARPKKKIESSLTLSADITTIAPGTPERETFESDFRTTMAASLGALVQPEDISISSITATPTGQDMKSTRSSRITRHS